MGQPQTTPSAPNAEEEALRRRLQQQMQQAQNLSQYTDPQRLRALGFQANLIAEQQGFQRPPYDSNQARYGFKDLSRLGEFRAMQGQYETAVSDALKQRTGYGSIDEIQRMAPVAVQQAEEAANREWGRYYENLARGFYTPPPSGNRDIGTFYG